MQIKALNNLAEQAQYSFLTDSYASGVGTVGLKNINAFPADYALQLGKTGEEQTEIKLIDSVSGSNLILGAVTTYEHPVDTPVYAIKFNQIIFKKSASGTAGTATAITSGTVSITPDSQVTVFDDGAGLTTDAYRTCYYNSSTGDTSVDSDWLTPSGFSFYSLAKMKERVKNKLYSAGYLKADDTQVSDWINEWQERMNNAAIEVNQDYSIGSTSIAHGTSGLGTIADSDFKEIRRIWFTTNGSDYFQARKIHMTDVYPGEVYADTNPYYYMMGDNVFCKAPSGNSGTVSILYYKLQEPLSSDTDQLPVSMWGYTKSFVDYGLSQAYFLDDKLDQGKIFLTSASSELERFKQEMTPRSKTGPTFIKKTEEITADDPFYFI